MRLRRPGSTLDIDDAGESAPAETGVAPSSTSRPSHRADETSEEHRPSAADGADAERTPTVPPSAEATPVLDAGSEPETRRGPSTIVLAGAALALVGLVVMALGGLSWWRAGHDDDISAAQTRDRALVAASSDIATLNTLDYRDVPGGLKSWLAVTTGTLHDQLAQAGSQDQQLLAGQKKISTGKVVDAALTDLDASGGTATAIASVEITVRGTTGQPTLKRNRFSANLVLTKGRWLLESLTQVPVGAS